MPFMTTRLRYKLNNQLQLKKLRQFKTSANIVSLFIPLPDHHQARDDQTYRSHPNAHIKKLMKCP